MFLLILMLGGGYRSLQILYLWICPMLQKFGTCCPSRKFLPLIICPSICCHFVGNSHVNNVVGYLLLTPFQIVGHFNFVLNRKFIGEWISITSK